MKNNNSISDLFAYAKKDEPFLMYKQNIQEQNTNKLYVLNSYGKKIIQLIINDEKNSDNKIFAQIKIIPYGIKVIKDLESLTEQNKRFQSAEITYHGSNDIVKSSKIHFKYKNKVNKYETIVDNSCELKQNNNIPIPLFSVNIGNLFTNKKIDIIKKNVVKFKIEPQTPVKLEFFLVGKNFNMEEYMNSMYSFNMFFSFDYLIKKNRHPLNNSYMMQPVEIYTIKGYSIFVKCSNTDYTKSPYLQFFNNQDFYNNFLDRDMYYLNSDGTLSEKISMKDREKELKD